MGACEEKEVLKSKAAISLPMTGATETWMDDDDDNFGGFSSSDEEITPEDENIKDEIPDTKPEEKVKEEAAVEPEASAEIKACEEKNEPKKEIIKSKAAISLPMTGATEAWMEEEDDNFGGFSSSDDEITPEDQTKKDDSTVKIPEQKVKEEAAVEPEATAVIKACEEKEVLKSKAAISLPMTGATETWMDDDDNFGGFSSSDDEITPENQNIKDDIPDTKLEEKVKE